MNTWERFVSWITSWTITSGRKAANGGGPSTTSNNSSGITVSALKNSTKLTSSNVKKVVRFAENNGKVVTEVFEPNDGNKAVKLVRSLDESIDEVFINDGKITGFFKVKHLERGREVLVRYTEDKWESFSQVKPRRVYGTTNSKGRPVLKPVKESRPNRLLKRRKQVNPSAGISTAGQDMNYMFKIDVSNTEIEFVIISSMNNVIDTNHQQCYQFKCPRRSWESSETTLATTRSIPSPRDMYSSRQS